MPLPADYHMHTPLCHHAKGEPTEYAARAVALGLREIGFSDHSPMARDGFDQWRMEFSRLDDYVAAVRRAQADHPGLTIKLALEVDYLPGHEEWIRHLATLHPWDYFIGSVHYLGSWDIDNPEKISEWKKRPAWEVWSAYAEMLERAAGSGLFDIIGHADLPKKFAIYPDRDATALFEPMLRTAAARKVAVELNTAGLRKDCKEIYPSLSILRLAHECGVAITFGSDAHAPEEVGMNLADAVALAKTAGYTQYLNFSRRQAESVPI